MRARGAPPALRLPLGLALRPFLAFFAMTSTLFSPKNSKCFRIVWVTLRIREDARRIRGGFYILRQNGGVAVWPVAVRDQHGPRYKRIVRSATHGSRHVAATCNRRAHGVNILSPSAFGYCERSFIFLPVTVLVCIQMNTFGGVYSPRAHKC